MKRLALATAFLGFSFSVQADPSMAYMYAYVVQQSQTGQLPVVEQQADQRPEHVRYRNVTNEYAVSVNEYSKFPVDPNTN
jgi:hypothetical protein